MSNRFILVALALIVGFTPWSVADADILFRDTFEDGSATDGSPVTWTPLTGFDDGTLEVVGGNYVIRSNSRLGIVPAVEEVIATDVSIRTQVRVEGGVDGISMLARLSEGSHTYQGGIDTTGDVYIGWNDGNAVYHNLVDKVTDLRPQLEDVVLQFDVIGNSLRMFAWRVSESKPTTPTVQVVDNQFPGSGQIGLVYDPTTFASASGTFRYVYAATTPIPEPSSLGLVGGSLLVLGIWFRCRGVQPKTDSK